MAKRGVVWAISHSDWLDELIVSARSCARVMPKVDRILYVTESMRETLGHEMISTFTSVFVLENPRHAHRPRFDAMLECDLDEAIFIDTDTYFAEPVEDLFLILKHYDIAAFPAPQHIHPAAIEKKIYTKLPRVSMAIPEMNGGLIVASMTQKMKTFVMEWSRLFKICQNSGYNMDQFSFRVALALSELRVAYVPNTYNFRANLPQFVQGTVKIVHAHGELAQIAAAVNRSADFRLYKPDPRLVYGFAPKARLKRMAARRNP